jgi:hypothetical protein
MADSENENEIENSNNEKSELESEWCNKLTLELLLNKNHYEKYLSKNDPKKFAEYREYKSKLNKYEMEIIDITGQLIQNPERGFSKQIEETFEPYMKSIIKYLEVKAIENPDDNGNHIGHGHEEDDDMLFTKIEPPVVQSSNKTKNIRMNHFDMSIFNK